MVIEIREIRQILDNTGKQL